MVLRGLFRLITYPVICYFAIIYYHAKSNDPEGFNVLKAAFNIPSSSNNVIEPIDQAKEEPSESDSKDQLVNEQNIEGLEYPPQVAPKSKSIKPLINDMCQDLLQQRQVLYDLATSCQLLQVHSDQNNKCYADIPYYERPLNYKLLQNANVYTAHMESTSIKLKNASKILDSAANLSSLPADITDVVKECGSTCLPLAKILYNQPKVPEAFKQTTRAEYKTAFDNIDQVLQASLRQSQTNILASQAEKPATSNIDSRNIIAHKSAISQLNEHFAFLKEQKIITPDHIDQNSLANFLEHAPNIKFT